MRKYIIIALLLINGNLCQAQADANNYMTLTVSTTPSFTLNSASLLENAQVISNAFQFTIESDRNDCSVYASIPSGITTTQTTSMPSTAVCVQFNSTDLSAAYINSYSTSAIPLGTSNTFLFSKKKHVGYYCNWYYDLYLPAIGYTYNPGTYNYTIKFTMTQP